MSILDFPTAGQSSSIPCSRRSSWAAYIQDYKEILGDYTEARDLLGPNRHDIGITEKLNALHLQTPGDRVNVPIDHPKICQTMSIASSSSSVAEECQVAVDDEEPALKQTIYEPPEPHGPFHKWMRTIHRRVRHQAPLLGSADESPQRRRYSEIGHLSATRRKSHHRKSSSDSSFAFVSAVRSASVSLASVNAMTRSRRNTTRSQGMSVTERSSRASISMTRTSEENCMRETPLIADAAAVDRSFRRRKVLEELISTEEAYIGDVRFLMNVYVTILAALPSICVGLRSSINRNLTEIVELHEGLLSELHRVVPHSEYSQREISTQLLDSPIENCLHSHNHRRWSSLDAVPENDVRTDWLQNVSGMLSDPQVAAKVSNIFGKKINRFFIYEEYGATYEMMIKDIASAQHAMPDWETYQKGLETLAVTLGSVKSNEEGLRKALTTNDLLVKPIQRICKYPLLFAELLKHTPVIDCPNSHTEIDATLARLREATAEINRASDDARMKETLEKTWLLQDRLVFPDRKSDPYSMSQIRSFGHLRLCGTLHVCWQTSGGVRGQYLICLLYRNVLCLASACTVEPVYSIQACINVNEINIEDADNGRGLQCHTAPFSWKVVFESDHELYELIMTACTPKEEVEWRARLTRQASDTQQVRETDIFTSVYMDIKSLGTVFGKPGTVARQISIHRATTVGQKTPLCQVVLKNTSVVRDFNSNAPAVSAINRSQSLLTTTARVPVLAPTRSDRARLEALLSDVWSREILPFPGMTARSRSEHLVRSSASTVIRKLSVASFASSFAKRPCSSTRRTVSSEYIASVETSKRRDAASQYEAMPEHLDHKGAHFRKAKRQRTTKYDIDYEASTHGVEDSGTVRRRKPREIPGRNIREAGNARSLSTTATSREIILPKRHTSPRAIYLPDEVERVRKASIEKPRPFSKWQKTAGTKNERSGNIRKLFFMGREF